jgi:hypothetical protein
MIVSCQRDASAASVTAVLPYLCYARKGRNSKPRDPVTTRYVAMLRQFGFRSTLHVYGSGRQNAIRAGSKEALCSSEYWFPSI